MLCTRPDVNLAISLVGRYQSNPGMEHWTAVKNILKYLKRTRDMFLVYGGDEELVVKGMSMLASTQIWMTPSHKLDTCIFEWWGSQLVQLQAKRRGGIYM